MPKKRHKPEEIVAKLRQVDVLVSQGQSVADAIRSIGVTEVSYYRWRREFGGLKTDQVRRMKELEAENARLRRAVADLTLDKLMQSLPQSQREVLVMLKVSGLSIEEIAAIQGSTVGAIKLRAHRAYETLRKLLGSKGGPQ